MIQATAMTKGLRQAVDQEQTHSHPFYRILQRRSSVHNDVLPNFSFSGDTNHKLTGPPTTLTYQYTTAY